MDYERVGKPSCIIVIVSTLLIFIVYYRTSYRVSVREIVLVHPNASSQIAGGSGQVRLLRREQETIFHLKKIESKAGAHFGAQPSQMRIAIDPGHIGGNAVMQEIEEKHVRLKDLEGNILAFEEADLSLATALLLSRKLRLSGFEVYLTRTKPGLTAFGKTYRAWLEEDFARVIDSLYRGGSLSPGRYQYLMDNRSQPKVIFHSFFKNHELSQRQTLVNLFDPDLTIVIHYNVHAAGRLDSGSDYHQPTKENYHLAFVPGAFMAGELETDEAIDDFLFLWTSSIIEESIDLSDRILQELEKGTGISPVGREFEDRYPFTHCVFTGTPGVYARNLAMTRFTKAPICFIELLCQDNLSEAQLLADTSLMIGPIKSSPRVREIADALYHGIMNYCMSKSEAN